MLCAHLKKYASGDAAANGLERYTTTHMFKCDHCHKWHRTGRPPWLYGTEPWVPQTAENGSEGR